MCFSKTTNISYQLGLNYFFGRHTRFPLQCPPNTFVHKNALRGWRAISTPIVAAWHLAIEPSLG